MSTLKTEEGWQAWDVACKMASQIIDHFPLLTAFALAERLGYAPKAMAELLPVASDAFAEVLERDASK